MTVDEFLAWEREQELRYEFDGFAVHAMNGGTIAHSEIATTSVEALRRALSGTACRALRGDVKILVGGRVRYPDAVVTCSPLANDAHVVPEPVVVFEVLSTGTADTDRIVKNAECRDTPSIQHYVMIEQDKVAATVFSRRGDAWLGVLLIGDVALELPAIGVEVPLSALYAGLDVETPGPD